MNDPYADYQWRPTNLPSASQRTDDIWFVDALTGWAVNSDGWIRKTEDGGDTWTDQAEFPGTYLRCIGFANSNVGWVGTFDSSLRLIQTKDGGTTWEPVMNLPGPNPLWICGLCVVDENVVYAAGTNDQKHRATVLKTLDGGASWSVIDMHQHAASLVDIYFEDEQRGWVVGGVDIVQHPGRVGTRGDLVPGIFRTLDGGKTWENKIGGVRYVKDRGGILPQGEWCWKIQVVDENTIVVANQNYRDGAILRSEDRGETWDRFRINDRQRNSNLEGIGFLNSSRGWVGGWGDYRYEGGYTSVTHDGGMNWIESNEAGFRINRFRFIGSPPTVGYASGDTVYKFSKNSNFSETNERRVADVLHGGFEGWDRVEFPIDVPPNCATLSVRIWNIAGSFVKLLIDEKSPIRPGQKSISWDFSNESGEIEEPSRFIVRVTTDQSAASFSVIRRFKI